MMKPAQSAVWPTRRAWLILAGSLVALYLFLLGTRGLNEPDEGRYANIALAMARPGGDWWEPRMSGYGHYDKPPLIYWAAALSFRAFGFNEWAARLPSLLGAVFALFGLGWTAYRLRGPHVAWWAVLICGTTAQFWVFGRILSPDMLLTGWCALAVAAWAEGRERGMRNAERGTGERAGTAWGWWLLSLLGWTLAWWTKATPALVPLLGLTVGVLATGDRAGRRALRPWLMFPATVALGAPWFLSMMRTYPELKDFFFGRELIGRLAGRVAGRHGAYWYYGPVSVVAWLPWWPVAIWAAWRAWAGHFNGPWRTVLAAWGRRLGVEGWLVAVGLAVLSLNGSKLASYTLTLAPWVALLMARAVVRVVADLPPGFRGIATLPAAIFMGMAGVSAMTLPSRWQSCLGPNSSLREVCDFLRAQGATRVDVDRYWPGAEFYLGEQVVHYVVRTDDSFRQDEDGSVQPETDAIKTERFQERDSDPGIWPPRFVHPADWPKLPPDAALADPAHPTANWWLIRTHRKGKAVIDAVLHEADPARRPVRVKRIGDFDVYRMPSGTP